MNTFLPYADFAQSAACLDGKRLIKQRLEVFQILGAINGGKGWANHPATRMWRPTTDALCLYGLAISLECEQRGWYSDLRARIHQYRKEQDPALVKMPKWLGMERFHASHRSNLLRKMPGWYSHFGWSEPNDLPYFWPNPEWIA